MKKIVCIVSLFFAVGAYCQETTPVQDDFKKNEISVNAAYLLFLGLEANYERALNTDFSVGASTLFFGYGDEGDDEQLKFHFSPLVRYYFGKKPVSGFFMEGFISVLNKNYRPWPRHDEDNNLVPRKNATSGAFGFAIGAKWQTPKGITFELYTGVGREPRPRTNDYSPFIGRAGVRVGYKF